MKLRNRLLQKAVVGVLGLAFSVALVGTAEAALPVEGKEEIFKNGLPSQPQQFLKSYMNENDTLLPPSMTSYRRYQPFMIIDHRRGFSLVTPFRVSDIGENKIVKPEKFDSPFFLVNSAFRNDELSLILLDIIRVDNKAPKEFTQEWWNTTWYNVPIEGMTKEKFLELGKTDFSRTRKQAYDGDLFKHDEAIFAYWTSLTNLEKQTALDKQKGKGRLEELSANFIPTKESTHEYTLDLTFTENNHEEVFSLFSTYIVPSFRVIEEKQTNLSYEALDKAVAFHQPKGFALSRKGEGEVVLRQDKVLWELRHFSPTNKPENSKLAVANNKAFMSQVQFADQYVKALVESGNYDIEGYYALWEDGDLGSVVYGKEKAPLLKVDKKGEKEKTNHFLTYLKVLEDDSVVVSRISFVPTEKFSYQEAAEIGSKILSTSSPKKEGK